MVVPIVEAAEDKDPLPPLSLPGGVESRLLTRDHAEEVQELFVRCEDYFRILSGKPPDQNEAIQFFMGEVPPGFSPERRRIEGVQQDGRLIALLDTLRDYPDEHSWWIGLLIVDPRHRRSGLGKAIAQAFERRAKNRGYRQSALAILKDNPTAWSFWRGLGYRETEIVRSVAFGELEHQAVRCIKILES